MNLGFESISEVYLYLYLNFVVDLNLCAELDLCFISNCEVDFDFGLNVELDSNFSLDVVLNVHM